MGHPVFEIVKSGTVNKRLLNSRWVYAIKTLVDNKIRFIARVVARGYTQVYGEDFHDTYSPVVAITSTRLIIAYAAEMNLLMKQFDIKTAFLYGRLNEEIFMEPPEGYRNDGEVWKLTRSLYGLKQSPRMWNFRFREVLEKLGLVMSKYDSSIFYQLEPIIIVIIYVDDGLVFARHEGDIDGVMNRLRQEFKMRELEVRVYRGLEIKVLEKGIFVHQREYVNKVLGQFGMENANPSDQPLITLDRENETKLDEELPYKRLVGCLCQKKEGLTKIKGLGTRSYGLRLGLLRC
jgi:hypothetical protein